MTDDREPRVPDEERAEAGAERFGRYLDALLAGARPSPDDIGSPDEAEMAHVAAEMAAAADRAGSTPDPAFVDQLRRRIRDADQGMTSVTEPLPIRPVVSDTSVARMRVTRRQVLQTGLGAAAGLAAGVLGAGLLRGEPTPRDPIWDDGIGLVAGEGAWVPVATLAELPRGAAVPFSTAAFNGYVVNDDGEIRALSSVCTHMGCTLQYRPEWRDLRCPCHAASFNLAGKLANSRAAWQAAGGYGGDDQAYPIELPPLIRPAVKVEGEQILVWTARA
ncbi:MAG: Rieske (2Fe-2S) protein [Chloroflexota bacterium]|nr:Rieske (2Fe-2S) protein [Chloroflexota bacterium]